MAFQIAICDDEIEMTHMLRDEIEKYNNDKKIEGDIKLFQSSKKLLEEILDKDTKFDILLLDVDMPELSGFDIARVVKEKTNSLIIFVTSHEELVFNAFEVTMFRYIRKHRVQAELPRALEAAYEIVEATEDDRVVVIKEKDRSVEVKQGEICYFEVRRRRVEVYLVNEQVLETWVTIKEFLGELDSEIFVNISRGCYVNVRYIQDISESCVLLDTGERLKGSPSKIKEAKIQIARYWRNHENTSSV